MYKIINITDHTGNIKEVFLEELRNEHKDMTGYFLYPISTATRLCFIWADKSNKILRTSIVKDYTEDNKVLKVKTENSIYILERVK